MSDKKLEQINSRDLVLNEFGELELSEELQEAVTGGTGLDLAARGKKSRNFICINRLCKVERKKVTEQ